MTVKAYTLPLVISLALHALVFGLMFANWSPKSETREVKRPQAIQAKIVEFTPKSQRQSEQAAQQKVIDMRQRQQERERQEAERRRQQQEEARRAKAQKEKEQREREAKAERERKEAERKKREQQEAERRRQQELEAERKRIERQRQLEQALSEEEEFFEAQQAQEVAQSYVNVIAERIENNWSRPPSARAGMEVVLEIQLVPTGQVVDVSVVESSGNGAFDRSAEQAVKRIDRFEEVQDMPSEVFERHFRQLRLEFKPEDLRL
ncbi:cell envelope integrity protein TolA [Marinimicrobium locisalis]|uniref:cell envelope integrity protein TolA n=1 Tax=Marinimicrobium locisalis TaxID=546022 RepID=UPI003221D817